MSETSLLDISVGCTTQAGIKPINEDMASFHIPEQTHVLENKGVCCVLCDGVSSAEAGQQASNISVNQFIEDYYKTPDTWSVAHAGQKILSATNLTLYKKSHEFANEEKGYLCTFVGLTFKSQTAHFFHIGDSRIFHIRKTAQHPQGKFTQLTSDHCATISAGRSYLTRALGMDNNLHVDYGKLNIEPEDIFIMTSDGVHDFVTPEKMIEVINNGQSEQQQSDLLVQLALENDSDDNVSCVVARVNSIAKESLDDYNTKLTRLPFPPPLEAGMKLDGYKVEKELFASSRSQLYLVTDMASDEQMVMKTPSPNFIDDTSYIDRFIQEEWVGKRIISEHIVQMLSQNRPRTCLYYLMEYVEGIGLDEWIKKHPFPSPKRAINIVNQIAAGLKAFHERDAIHQDLKPGNVLVDKNDKVKIVDFGSTFVAGTAELFSPIQHEGALGTASYSDPQYLLGKNPGIQGDLYALATITYEIFTGKLPYGEKIEECTSAFDYDHLRYHSASYFNPVIPIWFDRALEKGVQMDTEKRYGTIDQFLHDLTHPNPEFLQDVPEASNKKSSITFWLMLSGFWVLLFIVVMTMFK